MSGTEALYWNESLAATAHRIRDAVFEHTGLWVSIGGGASRLIAKMAVEMAKPKPGSGATGVQIVPTGDEATFLSPLRLADLPMVGPKLARKLERFGMLTIADAQHAGMELLVRRLGARSGEWLFRRASGIDESIVHERSTQKQVSREDTFAHDLHEQEDVERELLRLAVRVSADLREQSLRTRTVTVKLRDADFTTRSAQRTLRTPIESEQSVVRVALVLLRMLRSRRRVGVRLLGIALSHFEGESQPTVAQLVLFESPRSEKTELDEPVEGDRDRALTSAVDRIRARFGRSAILPAALIQQTDTGPRVEE